MKPKKSSNKSTNQTNKDQFSTINKPAVFNALSIFAKPVGFFRLVLHSTSALTMLFTSASFLTVLHDKLESTKKSLDEVHKQAFETNRNLDNPKTLPNNFETEVLNKVEEFAEEEGFDKKIYYNNKISRIDTKIKQLLALKEQYIEKLNALAEENVKKIEEKDLKENKCPLKTVDDKIHLKISKPTRNFKKYSIHSDCISGLKVIKKDSATFVLSSSLDGKIECNQLVNEDLINSYTINTKHRVYCMNSIDNELLVAGDNSNNVKAYQTKENSEIYQTYDFQGHRSAVYCLDVDDRFIMSASKDQTVKQWDIKTQQCLNTIDLSWGLCTKLDPKNKDVSDIDIGSLCSLYERAAIGVVKFKGICMMCGTIDGAIRLYDLRTNQQFRTLKGHTKNVMQIKFLNSNKISSCGIDGKLITWDLRTGQHLEVVDYAFPLTDFITNGKYIYSVGMTQNIQAYNIKSFRKHELKNESLSPTWSLSFDDELQCIYQGFYNGDIGLYPL